MKILVTGAAGFIGFHLINRLATDGHEVVGLDSINDYYDVELKYARLSEAGIMREEISPGKLVQSKKKPDYSFIQLQLEESEALQELFANQRFTHVVNLAAQAGVRYSIENPGAYIQSNIVGFANLLECCRHNEIEHLVYASSSSVYGMNKKIPFSTSDNVDHPVSLYAATKKSNELLAHTYSHLFDLPTTGLRFFTVYGPWGRPDMAYFLFAKAILNDEPIKVFNFGKMQRDFTYIDDIVEGITRVMLNIPKGKTKLSGEHLDPATSAAPYQIYNIGNNAPVNLMKFIEVIEKRFGKVAQKEMMPIQPGDVELTYANVDRLIEDVDYKPDTSLEEGIDAFASWYLAYYKTI